MHVRFFFREACALDFLRRGFGLQVRTVQARILFGLAIIRQPRLIFSLTSTVTNCRNSQPHSRLTLGAAGQLSL